MSLRDAVSLAGMLCCAAIAQDSKLLHQCMDTAKTQSAMRVCANEEAVRADAAMDAAYQKVLAIGGDIAHSKIVAAQKSWIAYRDAFVDAYCPEQPISQRCGTSYFTDSLLVRAALTWKQTAELNALLEHYVLR